MPGVTFTVQPHIPTFQQFHTDNPNPAQPVERKGREKPAAGVSDNDVNLAQNLVAPMLALSNITNIFFSGFAPAPKVQATAPPAPHASPATKPPADISLGDISFDG